MSRTLGIRTLKLWSSFFFASDSLPNALSLALSSSYKNEKKCIPVFKLTFHELKSFPISTDFRNSSLLKDTLKVSIILKTSNKNVWSNVFWYVKVHINVKKISFGQNKRYTKCSFFLSRASTHHGFTFNLWILYELKHKVHHSKIMWRIPHFRFHHVKVFIFVQQKIWTLWL